MFRLIIIILLLIIPMLKSFIKYRSSHIKRTIIINFNNINDNNIQESIKRSLIKKDKLIMKKQNQKFSKVSKIEENVEYTFDNDDIRSVKPYVYEFITFAKGRWLGRTLINILETEFGGIPIEYWQNAIKYGHVKINDKNVSETYIMKNSDKLRHVKHRHEPPIKGKITFVGETSSIYAICKPPSLPIHPCGAYRHNSVMHILKNEPLKSDQPETLYLVHRIDRVTSGLLILAKNKEYANIVSQEIKNKTTTKYYYARVKGKFPGNLDLLKQLPDDQLWKMSDDDDKDDKDDNDNEEVSNSLPMKRKLDEDDKNNENQEDWVSIIRKDVPTLVSVAKADGVGYGYGKDNDGENVLVLRCPVGIISYKGGIHACKIDGKTAISTFKCIGYDADSDTSLIVCSPYTGRTHQLRLHLQFLGNPIANDPCYGGVLFYGDDNRRKTAINLLKEMKHKGLTPISKAPHLQDEELDDIYFHNPDNNTSINNNNNNNNSCNHDDQDIGLKDGESEIDYLKRTCKYCKESKSMELESLLHCDGIWLHALRYRGNGWDFRTPDPVWTDIFLNKKIEL